VTGLRRCVMRLVTLYGATVLIAHAAPALSSTNVTDDRGRVVTFAQPPQRIVSLLPSLTEAVCELQACDRLVGVDRFSNWPARAAVLPKVGGLEDAQVERIVALKPDLVLAAQSARVIDRLESLGLKVLALQAKSLADTRRVLEAVATALGNTGAGEELWQRIDARIGAAAARVPASLRGQRVYFEIAATPYAAGEASFVGETLTRLGLRNIVPASLGPFPKLNPEYVVRAQPGIVMASEQNLAEMGKRPGWSTLRALRERQQCGFPLERYDVLVRPGPRLGEAAETMVACLITIDKVRP
jgi:iron complex transport system substrate-binding protein